MRNIFLILVFLASFRAAAAEERICAAITHCDTQQVVRASHKKSTFTNSLKFDELCGADDHLLSLKGGQQLELKIVKEKVEAQLFAPGGKSVLATKKIGLKKEKLTLKYKGEDESTSITCSK